LQQYNKLAANKKWHYKSSTFAKKGFITTNTLDVYLTNKKTNMALVASFLLAKIVERVFTDDDVALDLIAKTKVIPDMKPSMRVSVLKKEAQTCI
jgi:hypothetical protein